MKLKLSLLLCALAACLVTSASALTVGSYNIRYDNKGDRQNGNGWDQRAPIIASLVRFHGFDIFGTQEGISTQMADLMKLLPEYACISYGRDDGDQKGEHMGIFYRKSLFDREDSGRFWLSETPDQPGKGWDAALPRICTWAKLKPKSSGASLCFMSIHFDHIGVTARNESAKLLSKKAIEIVGDGSAILVGDFNSSQDSEVYKTMTHLPNFVDSREKAAIRFELNGTFNQFDPNSWSGTRIDYIFVSPNFRVRRYGVLTDSYRTPFEEPTADGEKKSTEIKWVRSVARMPSDHFPILAELEQP